MTATSVLNLDYSFLVDPKAANPNITTFYETATGLWNEYARDGMSYRLIDNLVGLHGTISHINNKYAPTDPHNYVTLTEPKINNQLITVAVHGSPKFVSSTRRDILQSYNHVSYKTVQLSQQEFLAIGAKFTTQMLEVAKKYHVEIIINNVRHFDNKSKAVSLNEFYIHILGSHDNITVSEPALRILINTILNHHYVDSVDIQLSTIPVLGGVNLFNFNQIAKQAHSSIYIPNLLPNLYSSKVLNNTEQLKIWITAKTAPDLLLTKNILNKLIDSRKKRFVTKEVELSRAKIDAIALYNQKQLLDIMFKHRVFVQLPSLGESTSSTVVVQGVSLESVEAAIGDINTLSGGYYSIILATNAFNEYMLVQLVQLKKTCTITSSSHHGVEITGSSTEIKQILHKLSLVQFSYSTIRLRLELSNSQRDFISGKKNGKLIKILNQLNLLPMIKFQPFNEYSFFIDFEIYDGLDLLVLIKGLELIELELPAELEFNIPEVFHKSIIGNGGSIIQSIMKKYNVFIKFSTTNADKDTTDFYSYKRFNNVLIKCPRKNGSNINLVKYEIDQLVQQCCMNKVPRLATTTVYHTTKFTLLKSHYLLLVNNNKLPAITALERNHNCFIDFPTTLDVFDGGVNQYVFGIKGSEAKTKECFHQLQAMMPENYEFKVTYNPGRFEDNFGGSMDEFVQRVAIPFKLLLGVEVIVNEKPMGATNLQHHQILVSYYDNKHLDTAIHQLTLYLREKGFLIEDKKQWEKPAAPQPVYPLAPITNQVHSHTLKNKGRRLPQKRTLNGHQAQHANQVVYSAGW